MWWDSFEWFSALAVRLCPKSEKKKSFIGIWTLYFSQIWHCKTSFFESQQGRRTIEKQCPLKTKKTPKKWKKSRVSGALTSPALSCKDSSIDSVALVLQTSYQKMWKLSPDGASGKLFYCDLFFQDQNTIYFANTILLGILASLLDKNKQVYDKQNCRRRTNKSIKVLLHDNYENT